MQELSFFCFCFRLFPSDGSGVGTVYMCESISVYGLERGGWSESHVC